MDDSSSLYILHPTDWGTWIAYTIVATPPRTFTLTSEVAAELYYFSFKSELLSPASCHFFYVRINLNFIFRGFRRRPTIYTDPCWI